MRGTDPHVRGEDSLGRSGAPSPGTMNPHECGEDAHARPWSHACGETRSTARLGVRTGREACRHRKDSHHRRLTPTLVGRATYRPAGRPAVRLIPTRVGKHRFLSGP